MKEAKKKPTIAQAKQMDMVLYLAGLGFHPQRIMAQEYWYISPFRPTERTASFKIEKTRKLWYDHGEAKGGNIITFATLFFQCSIPEFLESLAGNVHLIPAMETLPAADNSPGHDTPSAITLTHIRSITEPALIAYLGQRRIPLHIADKFCREIHYLINQRSYYGIGMETDSNSYEIRNAYAKISSPPKAIRTIANGANHVYVFEGFMDLLSFVTINPEHPDFPHDYLILNSVNQFEKARPFMEQHQFIYLLLDHDQAGRRITDYALSLSPKYLDESKLYQGYKDLNDWHVNFGKTTGSPPQ